MYSLILMMSMNGGAAEAPQFHKKRDYTPYTVVNGCCGGGCCGGTPMVAAGCCGGCCGGAPVVMSGCGGCCGGMPMATGCCGGFATTHWGYGNYAQTNWSEGCACGPTAGIEMGTTIITGTQPMMMGVPNQPMMTAPATVVPAPPAAVPNPDSYQPKEMPKKPLTLESGIPNLMRSDVTLLLPAGAKLYVNNAESASANRDGRFETPALPAGREFAYVFKAVVESSDGVRRETSRRVTFQAGESVRVDLRDTAVVRDDSKGR